ncbi:MAG: ABC transporter substrate-binding protein [Spirochaetia bacterium]|nr:ABC transporter substrate-binding protein [Spirochaetia bacterium]
MKNANNARFLILIIFLIFFQCKEKPRTESTSALYKFALRDSLQSEDPTFSVETTSGIVLSLLHKNLYKTQIDGKITNELTSEEYANKNILYLKIKKGILFNKPCEVELTAEDIEFSLNRLMNSNRQSWVLEGINKITAREPFLLEIEPFLNDKIDFEKWRKSIWPDIKARMTLPQAAVYSKKCYEEKNIFTGASQFFLSQNNSQFIKIKTRDNKLILKYDILPDESGRWFYFRRGMLDVYEAGGIFRDYSYDDEKFEKKDVETLLVFYAAVTLPDDKNSILHDVKFRQALNYRLNRKALTEKVLKGAYKSADYPVPDLLGEPPGAYYHFNENYKYDAKYKKDETVFIYSPSDRERQTVGLILRDLIEKLGIKAKLKIFDFPTILRFNNQRKPGIYLLKWVADYPHANNFLVPLFHSKNAGSLGNRAYLKDKEIDSLLDNIWQSPGNIKKVQKKIQEKAPWIFIGFGKQRYFINKNKKIKIPAIYTAWGEDAF